MTIDTRYVAAFNIETVILDKDTGAPLSGGLVYFYEDLQPTTFKKIYQITGTSPDYTFVELTQPVVLSSIGTFEDTLGNPIIPYFYPYDANGNPEYYFVKVTSSLGVEQFTRESVPWIPEAGGNEESLSAISNEISNPQFATVVFDTTDSSYVYNFTGAVNQVINIAPDWDLVVTSASGSVTLEQIAPTGSLNIVSNPNTILGINSSGVTTLKLRQRIYGSPNLWGSGYLNGSFVAKTFDGTPVTLNMYYSQSSGSVVDQLVVSGSLPASGNYQSFPGSINLPISNSSDDFPTAYIDIYFDIPVSTHIAITSVMLAISGTTAIADLPYDQSTYARQIDHLYHAAYPIVPVGTVIDFMGFGTPEHYLPCDGVVDYSRITYQELFRALTHIEAVTLLTGDPTFTVADGSIYSIGMPLEGTGIPPATTILSIAANLITMTANASFTGSSDVTFFIAGNGSTPGTFNTPNLNGYVLAGTDDGTLLGTGTGVGYRGGARTTAIGANNLPHHVHPTGIVGSEFLASIAAGGTKTDPAAGGTAVNSPTTGANVSDQLPISIVQPTALSRKFIRYQ